MDRGKCKAMVDWINSIGLGLCLESLVQLQSGQHFLRLLQLIEGDHHNGSVLDEDIHQRYKAIRGHIESSYKTSMENRVDFQAIIDTGCELNIAKVALLILAEGISCVNNFMFIEPATKLDTLCQMEIKEMIETLIAQENKPLDTDFASILKKPLGSLSPPEKTQPGAANLSASNCSAPQHPNTPVCSGTPHNLANQGNILRRFTSPQLFQVKQQASPMPMSPVQALLQSPQMASKISLQQRDQRIKRLERDLNNERHLRADLETDLTEKDSIIKEKDNMLREAQQQLSTLQRLKDEVDISHQLREEFDKRERDVLRLKKKLNDMDGIKTQLDNLEKENKELYNERFNLREQLKSQESMKKSFDELRLKSNQQEANLAQLMSQLHAAESQVLQLTTDGQMMTSQNQQLKELLQEKTVELAETRQSNASDTSCLGESMGVVTQLQDLEGQLKRVSEQYEEACHDRESMQSKFLGAQAEIMTLRDQVKQLQETVETGRADLQQLNNAKLVALQQAHSAEVTIVSMKKAETQMLSSVDALRGQCERLEEEREAAVKRLHKAQAELQLTRREIESQSMVHENRRKTLSHSVSEITGEKNQLMMRLEEQQVTFTSQVKQLENELKETKQKASTVEEELRNKLQSTNSSLRQLQLKAENELWTKDNIITSMKEEFREVQQETREKQEKLRSEMTEHREKMKQLDDCLTKERAEHQQQLSEGRKVFEDFQNSAQERYQKLAEDLEKSNTKNEELEMELHRHKYSADSKDQDVNKKMAALQAKITDKKQENDHLEEQIKVIQGQSKLLQDQLQTLQVNYDTKILENSSLDKQLKEAINCGEKYKHELREVKTATTERQAEYQTQICSLNMQLEEMNGSLSSKAKELQEHENRYRNQLHLIESQYNELKTRCEDKNRHIGELKAKVENLDSRLTQAKSTEENLREKLVEAEEQNKRELSSMKQIRIAETDVLNKKLSESTEHEDQLTKRLTQATQREHELKQTAAALELQLNETQAQAESTEEELRMQITDLEHKYTNDMTMLQTQNAAKLKQLEAEVDELRTVEEENKQKYESEISCLKNSYEKRISEMQSGYEAEQQKLNSTQSETFQQLKESHQASLTNAEKEYQKKLESLGQEHRQVADSLKSNHQSEIEKMQSSHKEEMDKTVEYVWELQQTQELLKKQFKQDADRMAKECSTAAALVAELEAQIVDMQAQFDNKLDDAKIKNDDNVSKLQQQIKKAEESIRWHKRQMSEMEIELDRQNMEESNRNTQIHDYQTKMAALQDKLKQQENYFSTTNTDLMNKYDEDTTSLKASVEKLQREMKEERSAAQQQREEHDKQLTEMTRQHGAEVHELRSQGQLAITQLQTALAESHTKSNELESQAKASHLKMLDELKQENENRLCELQNELSDRERRHESELSDIRHHSQMKIKQLEAQINATKMRATQTEGHIQELGRLKDNYENKVTQLTESVKKLSVQLSAASLERDTKEQQLQTERVKNQEHSSALLTQMTTIQTKAQEIQAELQSSLETAHSELNMWKLKAETSESEKAGLTERLSSMETRLVSHQAEAQEMSERLMNERREMQQHVQQSTQLYEEEKSSLSSKLQAQIGSLESEKSAMSQKMKELDGTLQQYMEREKRLIVDHQRNMHIASDMNQKLHKQLKEANHKIDEGKQSSSQQKLFMKEKEKLETEKDILQQKLNLQMKSKSKLQDQLSESESKCQHLTSELQRHKSHYEDKLKDSRTKLAQMDTLAAKYKSRSQNLELEVAPLKAANNKLGQQVKTLEAQMEHANRQLRVNRRVSSDSNLVLTGKQRAATTDSDITDMLDDSLEKDELSSDDCYNLRPRSHHTSPANVTLSSVHTPSLKSRKSFSIPNSVTPFAKTGSNTSILNNTLDGGMQTRSRSRNSLASVAPSSHFEPSVSTTIIPCGAGALFSCEDEPMQDFEWGRLGELQRRNTMCLPHLKTSYPVETQVCPNNDTSDEDLKYGQPENEYESVRYHTRSHSQNSLDERIKGGAGKKAHSTSNKVGPTSDGADISYYRHYSPQKSPRKKTPKRGKTPKVKTPSHSRRRRFSGITTPAKKLKQSFENTFGSSKNLDQSIAFDIGFTPKKMKKLLSSKKKDSQAMQPPRQPLKSRNDLPGQK